ncbi:hypothetical protein BT96DRAFT_944943 [Gymnopus androsaceus JB14]|uniref:Uncharacterized protein n=1 Tax=Gymnopus androsaceus JB14 TaxID=1447944 RepID=A0A6A4H1C3_9AGAR|nr:hypothetical protein BT96DRAFT_944943 [Gymnopus androsaceus JB14]
MVKSGEDDDEAGIIDSMTQLELALVWSLERQRTWVRTADVTTNNNTSMKCDGATMYLISVRQADLISQIDFFRQVAPVLWVEGFEIPGGVKEGIISMRPSTRWDKALDNGLL